jgi:hypothetical protein
MDIHDVILLNGRTYVELALPLTNSRGYSQIVRFDCYEDNSHIFPLIISPHTLSLGNSRLTRQAAYFLSDMDCVIRTYVFQERELQDQENWLTDNLEHLQTLADNCLFEYSIKNTSSRLTTHTERPPIVRYTEESIQQRFSWISDTDEYMWSDGGKSSLLEDSVTSFFENLYLNYTRRLLKNVKTRNSDVFEIRIKGISEPRSIPHIVFTERPYSYYDIEFISHVLPINKDVLPLSKILVSQRLDSPREIREWWINLFNNSRIFSDLSIEHPGYAIHEMNLSTVSLYESRRRYNKTLLSFYFAGLRSLSPINEFRAYYNIAEYMFPGNNDKANIKYVVNHYIDMYRMNDIIEKEIPKESLKHLKSYRGKVGQQLVNPVIVDSSDIRDMIAERIYQFRNAIFHSKRERSGNREENIHPSTDREYDIVTHEAQLMKIIAQEIIKKADIYI